MKTNQIGKYKIHRILSSHQGKKFYLASSPDENRAVTIKSLPIHDESHMPLTLREIQVLQRIEHPNVPPFIEAFFDRQSGIRYINLVLEYVDGTSIRNEILQKFHKPSEIIKVLGSILQVLDYLHNQNIIHRDITPGNIIRRRSDGRLMLVNFANAKTYNEMEGTGSISVGTVGYQAPEVVFGKATPQSDLYSLGVVALEMLSHTSPYKLLEGVFLKWENTASGLDPRMTTYLQKMLEFEVSNRFSSATEAYQNLKELTLPRNALNVQSRTSSDTTITTRQYFISKSLHQERKRRVGEAYRLWNKVIERIQNKDILPHKGARAYLKKIGDTKFEVIQTSSAHQYSVFLLPCSIATAMTKGSIQKGLYESIQFWLLNKYALDDERELDDLFELCVQILLLETEVQQKEFANRNNWFTRIFTHEDKNEDELDIITRRLKHDKGVLTRLAEKHSLYINPDFAKHPNASDVLSVVTRRRNKFLTNQANLEMQLLPQSKIESITTFTERAKDLSFEVSLLPAGQFRYAGKPDPNQKRGTKKTRPAITKLYEIRSSIWVSSLITQGLWEEIVGNNPSTDIHSNFMVERVSWLDSVLFCNQLSERFGYEAVYQIPDNARYWLTQEQTLSISKDVICDFKKSGFRLMTEAEWRYFQKNKKLPSKLFVRHSYQEWVWDWYLPNRKRWYLDTICPSSGIEKVLLTNDEQLASGGTSHDMPGQRYRFVGFRICRIFQ